MCFRRHCVVWASSEPKISGKKSNQSSIQATRKSQPLDYGQQTLSNWIYKRRSTHKLFSWLALDAWIDSGLYETWLDVKDRWNAASSFFARFRVSGTKRVITELVSEGLSMGTCGLFVLLSLAVPAISEIDEDNWLATDKYSVTFLDRFGNEIGKRGVLQDDAVPLEDLNVLV